MSASEGKSILRHQGTTGLATSGVFGRVAAETLCDKRLRRPIDAMLTTRLSVVPAISCLTSTAVSMASTTCSLRIIPPSTSRMTRLSHIIKAAWPCGSGVRVIRQDNADAQLCCHTKLSSVAPTAVVVIRGASMKPREAATVAVLSLGQHGEDPFDLVQRQIRDFRSGPTGAPATTPWRAVGRESLGQQDNENCASRLG